MEPPCVVVPVYRRLSASSGVVALETALARAFAVTESPWLLAVRLPAQRGMFC